MRKALSGVACLCALMLTPLTVPAMAQDAPAAETEAPAAEPDETTGNTKPVEGACYSANQTILGPYQLDFCLSRPGSYHAEGGDLSCEGRMSWRTAGRTILGHLHPTNCGAVQFQGAQLDCRPQSPDTPVPAELMACVLYPTNSAQRRQVFDASLEAGQ